ncbi:MAG: hypothetical protein ACREDE_05045 [Thermoplasmata archaeon]
MVPPTATVSSDPNFFSGLVRAIEDRHGELDIRLERLSLRLPLIAESIELNGTISISMHVRELTDEEKQARVAKEIRALSP